MARVLELGLIDLGELEQASEVEGSREAVDLLLGDVELAHQEAECDLIHIVGDFEPDRRAEAAVQNLLLECLQEVIRLVFIHLEVFVAGDAELVVLEDLHAGKQVAEMVRDEVFERDEPEQAALVVGELNEPGQVLRHLQTCEFLFTVLGAAYPDRQVERQPGDIGEWMRRVDGQRHQHGEDLGREDLVDADTVRSSEVGPGLDVDVCGVEGGLDQRAKRLRVTFLQFVRFHADQFQHRCGRASHVGRYGEPGQDAPLEPCDAHHEELVEVAREDGEEVGAFQQGERGIFCEFEHALVEGEPAQFAVEKAVWLQGSVIDTR